MPAADTTPRRLAPDERREQLLEAARRLLDDQPLSELSTAAIAREAGVARGLIHHYFGGKQGLFVELVRSMVRMPPPAAVPGDPRPVEEVVEDAMDRWLTMVERHKGTWLLSVGGHDAEVEAVLDDARELAGERFLSLAGLTPTPERRAWMRAYSAFCEEATLEWLQRARMDREAVHRLLTTTLIDLVRRYA
ncbi:MAG TPA: TetR/AcrR family transcriptional regulator [Baekduia sp.]|nr:TetR/AcrR family transcriptional regulator [Baekduia sp.]